MKSIQWSGRTPSIITKTNVIVWLSLNVADLVLTLVLVAYGIGYEANPFLRMFSPTDMVLTKLGLATAVAILFYRRNRIMLMLNIGIATVVLWNTGCLGLSAWM